MLTIDVSLLLMNDHKTSVASKKSFCEVYVQNVGQWKLGEAA